LGEKRVGGFVFRWWAGDHAPQHVHVYRDGRFLGRWDLERQQPMDPFVPTARLTRALKAAGFMKEEQ
jgi:hypothetical protein